MFRICPPTRFWFTVLLASLAFAAPGYGFQTSEGFSPDKVLDYLDAKGLARLAINHLESKLVAELDGQKREQLAIELGNRYRRYFFSSIAEPTAEDFIQRADWLSKNYPAVNTPEFRLAVNHANYVELERRFRKWWQNSAAPEGHSPLIGMFRELERKLAAQIRHDESQQLQLISEIATEPSSQLALQIRTERIEVRLLHSHYLFAWTSYFSAVLPNEISQPLLRQAQSSFYRALRIEQSEPIDQIDAKWLDFSAPISGRALLGLGFVYVALDRKKSAEFCFDQAMQISSPVFDRNIFEFNALAFSKKWKAAKEYVDQRMTGEFEGNKTDFWEAVTFAGFSQDSASTEPAVASDLKRAGLLGLSREFAFEQLRHFVVNEEINLGEDSYERKWIQILVQYHISAASDQNFEPHLDDIKQLLDSFEEKIQNSDLAKMKFLAAMMEYKRGQIKNAFEQVKDIDATRIQNEPAFVQRLDWLNVLIQLRRANQDTANNAIALESINRFIEHHPDSNSYQRALFERFKLTNRILPAAQALKNFDQADNTHPFYHELLLESVNCLRRAWLEEKSSDSRNVSLRKLIETVKKLRSLESINPELKLSSILVVIDVVLQRGSPGNPADAKLLGSLIADADSIVASDGSKIARTTLAYAKFRFARQLGETQDAVNLAQYICKNSKEKSHRITALALIAKLYEQDDPNVEIQLTPTQTYELLVQELGSASLELQQSRNARVAASRLVGLYSTNPRFAETAQELNNKLLQIEPDRLDLLLNRARVAMRLGKSELASQTWRKIGAAVNAGDDFWYEAKLGIVECLARTDSEAAASVLRQTENLSGTVPESWQIQIDKLKQTLEALK